MASRCYASDATRVHLSALSALITVDYPQSGSATSAERNKKAVAAATAAAAAGSTGAVEEAEKEDEEEEDEEDEEEKDEEDWRGMDDGAESALGAVASCRLRFFDSSIFSTFSTFFFFFFFPHPAPLLLLLQPLVPHPSRTLLYPSQSGIEIQPSLR